MIGPMRLVFALLTTFCLLFQQVAVAATACLMEQPPAEMSASGHCEEMNPVSESAALCKSHCAPEQTVVPDTRSPQLPFVAMLPPRLDFDFAQAMPDPVMPSFSLVHRSDPPARIRYCRLLI